MATISPQSWTEPMCIQLIREFRKESILWDQKDVYFYNKEMKPRAWQNISDKMNIPSEECKHKMGILMSSYRREKAKIVKSMRERGGSTDKSQIYKSTWFAFPEMTFLLDKPYRQETERKRHIMGTNEDTPILKKLMLSNQTSPSQMQTSKTTTQFVETMRVKTEPIPGPSVNPSDTEEEIQSFVKFISFKMKKYSEATKNAVQQAICDIIFEADQNNLANATNEKNIFNNTSDTLETTRTLGAKTLEAKEFNMEDECISIKVESDVEYYSENSDTGL